MTKPKLSVGTIVLPNSVLVSAITRYIAEEKKDAAALFSVRIMTHAHFINELKPLIEVDTGNSIGSLVRDALLRHLFVNADQIFKPGFEYYAASALKEGKGYSLAFSQVIGELDAAGLCPDDLEKAAKKSGLNPNFAMRFRDLARIWKQVIQATDQQSFGASIQALNIKLSKDPKAKETLDRAFGTILWVTNGFETPLLGESAAIIKANSTSFTQIPTLEYGASSSTTSTKYLLEQWSGFEGELQATVDWTLRSLADTENSCAALDIAILCDSSRAQSIATALTYQLPHELVHLATGRTITETQEGQAWLSVLHALKNGLSADSMLDLLPRLKAKDLQPEGLRGIWSRSAWLEIIAEGGAVGGSAIGSKGYKDWLELSQTDNEVKPYSEPISKLTEIFEKLLTGTALPEISLLLTQFLTKHMRTGEESPLILSQISNTVGDIGQFNWSSEIKGFESLDSIEAILSQLSIQESSIANARIYIGSPTSAIGLRFRYVRFMGASDGSFPSLPKEDTILIDEMRKIVHGGLRTSQRELERQQYALHSVASFAPKEFVLSYSRQGLDGNERDYSGLFFDFVEAAGGNKAKLRESLQASFHQTRRDNRELRLKSPRNRRDFVSSLRTSSLTQPKQTIPKEWSQFATAASEAFDIKRSLKESILAGQDLLGLRDGFHSDHRVVEQLEVPGQSAENPLRPSNIGTLLDCPYKFLLSTILGWDSPSELPEPGQIGPMTFGSIMHKAIHSIYKSDDKMAITPSDLASLTPAKIERLSLYWTEKMFTEFPITKFIKDGHATSDVKTRLATAIASLLETDKRNELTAVDGEFKIAAKLNIDKDKVLFIQGKPDRVENFGPKGAQVRIVDFKSGRGWGKDVEDLLPSYDIQVAVYALALEAIGRIKNKDLHSVEFRFPEKDRDAVRPFAAAELKTLLEATHEWLEQIHSILEKRNFVRTTDPENCGNCQYQAICGDRAPSNSHLKLETSKNAEHEKLLTFWEKWRVNNE